MKVGVIGYGNLGASLAEVLFSIGHLAFVVVRDETPFRNPGMVVLRSFNDILNADQIDILVLAVRDNQIEDVARNINAQLGAILANTVVIHCSGAVGVKALQDLHGTAKAIVAAHPFQTIHGATSTNNLQCAWGIEYSDTSSEVKKMVEEFVELVGGKAIDLTDELSDPDRRKFYHICAVFASSFTQSLWVAAEDCARLAGINPREFLPPIIGQASRNFNSALALGHPPPLTGPVIRSDEETIADHLLALEHHEQLRKVYQVMTDFLRSQKT